MGILHLGFLRGLKNQPTSDVCPCHGPLMLVDWSVDAGGCVP